MVDDDCTLNECVAQHTWMKNCDFNSNEARHTGRDRGFSGLLVNEWCWFLRSRAHSHRRTKESRQFKEGARLEPARVLLQEREGTREGRNLECGW